MKRVVSAPLLKLALQFLASSQIQMEASSSVVVISNAPEKISQHFEGGSREKTAVREKGRNFSFLSLRGENLEEFLFLSFSSVGEGRGTNREGPKVERERKKKSKKLYLDKWLGECLRAIP